MNNFFDSRDYGYTIISRLEEILRQVISDYVCLSDKAYSDFIPQGVIEAANRRYSEIDNIDTLLENVDFIHLKEIIVYKSNFENLINVREIDLNSFSLLMNSLYDLRIKIAHIKNIFTNSDLNSLINESLKVNELLISKNEDFVTFIYNIQDNPHGLVKKIPVDFLEEDFGLVNNLPLADYEFEGGFVGRTDDYDNIFKMLKSDRFHVITVAGAGGVGKSSLVLKLVKEVSRSSIIKYDFIVWVSAKENKLSYLGIEDIEPTLKNYEELLDTILTVLGFNPSDYAGDVEKKESDINSLFDMCDKVLIVIDNLETITDERIINFIIDYHPNVYFIITSRRGLGQVERRYDLKELKEKDAIHLFRVICEEKNLLNLKKADEKTISKYVNKVFCYPLAIKWVLGQAALGKDISLIIDSINEESSDISKFCFEQVFSELSENAQKILYALCLESDAVMQGTLKYIANMNDNDFEDTIRDLLIVSLILPEQRVNKETSEINSYFSLLPLTRGYVKVQLDNNKEIKAQIQERMITVENTIEEADRAQKQYRYSLSNFGATTEEEKIAAMLAQAAYQKHQAGNYEDAVETIKRATTIAPSFAPIYRNWALIESNEQHWVEADALMQKASKLNPSDTQIWLVWGNMKRKNDKIKEAYGYYEKAYNLSPNDNVVINSYAQAISRMGDYERADKLYKQALELVEGVPHNKHLIINNSSIAENLRKWAESLMADRDFENALKKLLEAQEAMQIVLRLDKDDSKAIELNADISLMIGNIYSRTGEYDKAKESYLNAVTNTEKSTRIKALRIHAMAILKIVDTYIKEEKYEDAEKYLSANEKSIKRIVRDSGISEKYRKTKERLDYNKNKKLGTIISVNCLRKFIVIEKNNCPGETYLGFFSECKDYISEENNPLGREVEFFPTEEAGKRMAKQIVLK